MTSRRKRTFRQSRIARNSSIGDGLARLGVVAGRNDGIRERTTMGLPAEGARRASSLGSHGAEGRSDTLQSFFTQNLDQLTQRNS